jgi:hypothetical protein
MNPQFKPSVRIEAKDTVTNRNCGVTAGTAGRMVFVDRSAVSILLDGAGGSVEASCEPEVIAWNFVVHEHDVAPGYVARSRYGARYPRDFLRSK